MAEKIDDLSAEILRQKAKATRGFDRARIYFLAGMGILVLYLALRWESWFESSESNNQPGDPIPLLILILSAIAFYVAKQRGKPKCPKCGFDWEIKEGSDISVLNWKCCPGCGLEMPKENGETHKP
jgi:hypothetical protein